MQLEYNGFLVEPCSTAWAIDRATTFTQFGKPFITNETWRITGYVRGETIPELTAKMQALQAAFSTHNSGDIRVLNNGSETAHKLLGADTTNGLKVLDFRWLRGNPPATEYVNRRSWSAVVQGQILGGSGQYLSFRDSIRFIGNGGPQVIWAPALVGPPQPQVVQTQTSVIAIQSGFATGVSERPPPAGLMFGEEYLKPKLSWVSPSTPQQLGEQPIGWGIQWYYVFEGLSFSGVPQFPSA